MERRLFCRLQCVYWMCVLYCWNEAIMMSVFQLIPQHQVLFLWYMRPTWRFGSEHVCECESVVWPSSSLLKDNSGLLEPGSYFHWSVWNKNTRLTHRIGKGKWRWILEWYHVLCRRPSQCRLMFQLCQLLSYHLCAHTFEWGIIIN